MSAVGVIGILLFFVGLHLLWRARREILDWTVEFVRIFRAEFVRRGAVPVPPAVAAPAPVESSAPHSRRAGRALLLVGAVGLIVLGQVLVLLDLAF